MLFCSAERMTTASHSLVSLPAKHRRALNSWLRSTTLRQGLSTRARILLDLHDGHSPTAVADAHRVSRKTVYKWVHRYQEFGLDGLEDQRRSGRPSVIDKKTVERVLKLTTERVPHESTRWSIMLMAKYAGVTPWQIRQIWAAADLKPHRLKTFKISNDPRSLAIQERSIACSINSLDSRWQYLAWCLIFNRSVVGSNPSRGAKKIRALRMFRRHKAFFAVIKRILAAIESFPFAGQSRQRDDIFVTLKSSKCTTPKGA